LSRLRYESTFQTTFVSARETASLFGTLATPEVQDVFHSQEERSNPVRCIRRQPEAQNRGRSEEVGYRLHLVNAKKRDVVAWRSRNEFAIEQIANQSQSESVEIAVQQPLRRSCRLYVNVRRHDQRPREAVVASRHVLINGKQSRRRTYSSEHADLDSFESALPPAKTLS
jgi:hypothetical protein